MRRFVLAAAIIVIATAGIACYLWASVWVGGPPPPIPDWLTDPPAWKAVEAKRQAVRAAPRSGAAWGELGMAFEAHEASPEAMTCYRRALALDPNDARWPFLLAGRLTQGEGTSDKEEAAALLRRAADCPGPSSSHRVTARLTLADLLTELGRRDEAIAIYEQVYSRDPSNPWAAYRVAMLLSERNEIEKASQILFGLLRDPYTQKKATIALAELSRRTGKTKEADEFDHTAGLLQPDHHWANPYSDDLGKFWRGQRALLNQFVTQEKAHQNKAAVSTATALADQYPSVETQGFLLRALVNAGDYEAALAVADDILRDPEGRKLVIAHSSMGLAKLGLADQAEAGGRTAEAHRLLTQAAEALGESVKLKPDYAPGYIYQAKALLRLGRLLEAESTARAGINCRPEQWEGYLVLADVLATAGRKADALAVAEQAVKLAHPNETRPRKALESLKK